MKTRKTSRTAQEQRWTLQLRYPVMTNHNSVSRRGQQMTPPRGYGKRNKMLRNAVGIVITCFSLTGSLGFANADALGTQGGLPRVVASNAHEGHIISYPQAVDNSPQLRKMIKTHARQLVTIWFGTKHWKAFQRIVYLESRWNYNSYNKSTGAYGLTQILGSKKYTFNRPYLQLLKSVQYIRGRYQTPTKALRHLLRYGWQ